MDWLAVKLSEAELLAESREGRFLTMIVDEVDDIADELGTIEIARAMIVAKLCDVLGKSGEDDISLSDLIAYAPPDIRSALTELPTELTDHLTATAARGTVSAQIQKATITAALNNLEPATHGKTGYDQWGARSTVAPSATRVNEILSETDPYGCFGSLAGASASASLAFWELATAAMFSWRTCS